MPEHQSVLIPKVSMATEEVTFVEWLVADGANVAEGDLIYSVATDKVESSIEAAASGVLRHGEAEEDELYAVGAEIGRIEPA
ncbi:biotin/lipoyl-containing protein [Rhodococcus sp. P1Y]|uniref:biotin/lipoyl-containing protein n=1 Tax=Rhodococcus sp. P1Y TaxID=1302308 RepID=UPI000EB19B8E|nr:biotin/lipoyl-containing protein [Rhodococcus sp. P1Y]AYJ50309.1 biotin-requiring enzyme family protein [Rhodococcus sp. P1Y]